jgi:cob(I)alamin adenosyltransferase
LTQKNNDINLRHAQKAQQRQKFQQQLVAQAPHEKNLLMVYTGTGKGKSTAAFGTVLRALGHGFNVGIVQFIKGAWSTGEQNALLRFSDLVTHHVIGDGFTWNTQDRTQDIATAHTAWQAAQDLLNDARYKLIVLDELNIVLRYNYLPLETVLSAVAARQCHVIITGRNAPPALIAAADLVTDMTLVKHPFREQGIKAQQGIEF